MDTAQVFETDAVDRFLQLDGRLTSPCFDSTPFPILQPLQLRTGLLCNLCSFVLDGARAETAEAPAGGEEGEGDARGRRSRWC